VPEAKEEIVNSAAMCEEQARSPMKEALVAAPEPARGHPATGEPGGRREGSAAGSDTSGSSAKLATLFERQAVENRGVKLARREVVYSEGQDDQYVYLIEFGQVKAVACSPSGRSCLLSIRTAGDLIGELGLLDSSRQETVSAMKPTRLRCMPLGEFRAALAEKGLFDEFLGYLLGQISEQQALIANMVTMNSEQRLAATILKLAVKIGTQRGGYTYINDRITQEELSLMVGTTRSRVGLFLQRFKTRGLIDAVGSSIAVNEEVLRDYLWECARAQH
jgi:CRP-like cAMP-binding protein